MDEKLKTTMATEKHTWNIKWRRHMAEIIQEVDKQTLSQDQKRPRNNQNEHIF